MAEAEDWDGEDPGRKNRFEDYNYWVTTDDGYIESYDSIEEVIEHYKD